MRMRKEGQRALPDSSLHPRNSSDLGFFSPQQHSFLGYVIYIEKETIPAILASPLIQSKLSAGQHSTLSTHPKDMSMCGGMEQTQISSRHSQVTARDCSQHPRAPLSCRVYAADTTITGHFSLSWCPSKGCHSLNIKDKAKTWLLGEKKKRYSVLKRKQH